MDQPITERRRKTRNSIYQCLYNSQESYSKPEIAKLLYLSLPTVHQNLGELLEAGLVQDCEFKQSTGGRRAVGYTIAANARFAIGISITEERIRFLAVNLRLEELGYQSVPFNPKDYTDISALLETVLETFIDENHLDRSRLLGVGISLPAVLDPEQREIIFAPTLKLDHVSIEILTKNIPYETYVENDGDSGGYAEWFIRRDKPNIAYLSLENGVGGAVLFDGKPYVGQNHRSGEFGHTCVEPEGLKCSCGKSGCLEAYCSASRISTNLGITLEEFFADLDANPKYTALWNDVLEHLAVGIHNIQMILDCDMVIGGFLSEYIEKYLPELQQMVAKLNPFKDGGTCIRMCWHPRRSVALGVALKYIQNFIQNI